MPVVAAPSVEFDKYVRVGVSVGPTFICEELSLKRAVQIGNTTVVEYAKSKFPISTQVSCVQVNENLVLFAFLPATTGTFTFKDVSP